MPDQPHAQPRLYLVVGPNGAGKSTFVRLLLAPVLPPGTPFVNADEIAKQRWPGEEEAHAYEAAALAERTRHALLDVGRSFIAETVASHPSKLELVERAQQAGYAVHVYVLLVPVDLAVARVRNRVASGGHSVPEQKIRERYQRLWSTVAAMALAADAAFLYDTADDVRPQLVARITAGHVDLLTRWPDWAPQELRELA